MVKKIKTYFDTLNHYVYLPCSQYCLVIAGVMLSPPPGTVSCLLCGGIISTQEEDQTKFRNHMKSIHEVFGNFQILLSLHYLKDGEKEALVAAVKERISKTDWEKEIETVQIERVVKDEEIRVGICTDDQSESIAEKNENKEMSDNIIGKKIFVENENEEPIIKDYAVYENNEFIKEERDNLYRNSSLSQCHNCQKHFPDLQKLHQHLSRKYKCHNKESIICLKCSKKFQFAKHLHDHIVIKHDFLKHEFGCKMCEKIFKYKKGLEYHINEKVCETGSFDNSCENCGKYFRLKTHSDRHECQKSSLQNKRKN